MRRSELFTTNFDHESIKQALIAYLKTTDEFGDFDYEGSAINTIVDLLTRNTAYQAFLANMLANESFIESAQMRGNVSAHAQKLSYVPTSYTASRIFADIEVTPRNTPTEKSITEKGLVFLANVGKQTFSFVAKDAYTFSYSPTMGKFIAKGVEMFQGQLLTHSVAYAGGSITLPNERADTSTLTVYVDDVTYTRADSITDFGAEKRVYFLRERTDGRYEFSFGSDVLGVEPAIGSTIKMEYINTELEHANGVKQLISGSTIGGYSNIKAIVDTPSFGGGDRDDIEEIRFIAPKVYQAQDRALSAFDYIPLIKSQFPFVKSVITWGGENNIPPRYGAVFVSMLTNDNTIITDTLAKNIEEYVRDKMVGSVLPIVTSPVWFMMEVDVQYKYNKNKSNSPRSEVEGFIKDTVFKYSEQSMRVFGGYYNQSEIVSQLKVNPAVESVIIDEKIKYGLSTYNNIDASYQINFDNPLKKGTLHAENFALFNGGTDHKMYDDGAGNVFVSYTVLGNKKTLRIGSIDYETGLVTISTKFIQDANIVEIRVTPRDENFYVRRNHVVNITDCTTTEMGAL